MGKESMGGSSITVMVSNRDKVTYLGLPIGLESW